MQRAVDILLSTSEAEKTKIQDLWHCLLAGSFCLPDPLKELLEKALIRRTIKLSALCSFQDPTQVSKEQLLLLTPRYLPWCISAHCSCLLGYRGSTGEGKDLLLSPRTIKCHLRVRDIMCKVSTATSPSPDGMSSMKLQLIFLTEPTPPSYVFPEHSVATSTVSFVSLYYNYLFAYLSPFHYTRSSLKSEAVFCLSPTPAASLHVADALRIWVGWMRRPKSISHIILAEGP